MSIAGQFCGQTQPHPAHTWEEQTVGNSSLTLTTRLQCGGYSPTPRLAAPARPDEPA